MTVQPLLIWFQIIRETAQASDTNSKGQGFLLRLVNTTNPPKPYLIACKTRHHNIEHTINNQEDDFIY